MSVARQRAARRQVKRMPKAFFEGLECRVFLAADFHWVGGGNTNSFTDSTNYTVGGAATMLIPGAGDTVFLDNNAAMTTQLTGATTIGRVKRGRS